MDNDNKMILQSYKLTEIRDDFGIYAQRLIVRIAERMQYRLEDADFIERKIKEGDQRLRWKFQLSELMIGNEEKNHTHVKEELRKVIKAGVHIELEHGWQESAVFTDIIAMDNGEIEVKMNDSVWDLFVEFSKGYKKYELETAMKLKTTYALRLYQLLAGNESPITYTIDWLRKMFGLKDKYKLTKDFIKRVIVTAQKELDEKSPTTFSFTPVYTKPKGRGRSTITAIRFVTIDTNKNANIEIRAKELNRKYGLTAISKNIKLKLMESYGFTENGIRSNASTLADAENLMKNPTLLEFLTEKLPKAQKAKNPQGWIINAIRSELETLI